MSRGGPRPDAGRKSNRNYFINGEKYKTLKEAAKKNGVVKSTILNWCKNDKKPDCWFEQKQSETIDDVNRKAAAVNMTPLEYMLKIMRDESEDTDRRIKMAYYAAPYVHSKPVETKPGKKEEREDLAKKAAKGKFSAGKPPLKVIQ